MTNQLLHIYLHFGHTTLEGGQDSWLKDIFISGFGAFLGVVGALAIYYWQIRRTQNDTLKYIVSLIESIVHYSKTQSEYCGRLIQNFNDDPAKLHLLHFQANYDLKRLADKVDQESFYHAYLTKYKRKKESYLSFKRIYSQVDFIDQTLDQLKDFLEKENLSITEKKKAFVNYFEEGEEKVALLTVNTKYQQEKALLDFLNLKLVEYHQTAPNNTDLHHPYKEFVEPVLNFLVENYPTDDECNKIAVLLRKSAAKYQVVIQQGTELAETLQEYQQALNVHAIELEVETEQLRRNYKVIS